MTDDVPHRTEESLRGPIASEGYAFNSWYIGKYGFHAPDFGHDYLVRFTPFIPPPGSAPMTGPLQTSNQ